MSVNLPELSGSQLIKLLENDGWIVTRRTTHGIALRKYFPEENRTRVTIISTHNETIPKGTLSAILGPKQTNPGKDGLQKLIEKYKLK